MEEKIDFVVTWVDGEDPEWLEEKRKYVPMPVNKNNDTDSKNRYRDMKTFKYWFRAVEKYAPWVNKVYFITWGHVPEWLNVNNEKLVVVNHKDFIPNEILPTFNSNSIEMYMNRINGLSEKFVYFNDDIFLGRKVNPNDFFKNGKPKDSLVFDALSFNKTDRTMSRILSNNIELLSAMFNKRQIIKKNFWKIFNLKYGKELFRTICLLPWKGFTGITNPHMGISYTKTSFNEVWERFGNEIYKSTQNRVRSENDISHWLVRYWQLMKGDFVPKRIKEDKRYPGVIIRDLDKSNFYDYTLIFIRDKLITDDDIKDFSDEFKENIKMRRETYGF